MMIVREIPEKLDQPRIENVSDIADSSGTSWSMISKQLERDDECCRFLCFARTFLDIGFGWKESNNSV